jgi:hypothetical protein
MSCAIVLFDMMCVYLLESLYRVCLGALIIPYLW